MTKLAALAAAALLLLPALAISAATGDINLSTPSGPALADIPPDYLLLYQQLLAIYALLNALDLFHKYPETNRMCWQALI